MGAKALCFKQLMKSCIVIFTKEFAEMMRVLRYPVTISIKSFSVPNFELVADLLYWMMQRYDPSINIHNSIDSESDRVQFISGVVNDFHDKNNVRLNAKMLYASDGHAVKELLKIARLLVNAVQVEMNHRLHPESNVQRGSIELCTDDIRALRTMATQITESGARLHSLLAKETNAKKAREEVSNFLETANTSFGHSAEFESIQDILHKQLDEVKRTLASIEEEFADIEADKNDVLADVKKKNDDLKRNNQRLESLENTRPAFMDEFEHFEIELQNHYELFMERYRNIHYLKHELEGVERDEQDQLNEANRNMKRLQAKIREEEKRVLKGDDGSFGEKKVLSSRNGMSSNLSGATRGPIHSISDLDESEETESEETSEIVIEDDSSTDRSSELMMSQSVDGDLDRTTESSSKASISVDSATYFLGSDEISDSGTSSKISSDDSDNNF